MTKICIISIGDELLIGQTVNNNATWMGQFLNSIGFDVAEVRTISDNKKQILDTLKDCFEKFDVTLITGGLGPTNDDLTMPLLAQFFDSEIVLNEAVLKSVQTRLSKFNIALNEKNRNQALVPKKAQPISNSKGTAPGLFFDEQGKYVFAMPGVPYEMKAMMQDFVAEKLQSRFSPEIIIHKNVMTQGIAESILATKIADWETKLPDCISLAYLPTLGRVKLRLSARGNNRNKLQQSISKAITNLEKIISEYIYAYDEKPMEEVIGNILREKKMTISTAESCTGGNIAHLITSIAGSSDYFKGSVVAYANEIKENILGVDKNDLEKYGAVSRQVVEQMALGIKNKFQTDCSIATSGIAGPGGGSNEKPVGTVWIAIAVEDKIKSTHFVYSGDRKLNIERFSNKALELFWKEIS